jgi:hypothetical protein
VLGGVLLIAAALIATSFDRGVSLAYAALRGDRLQQRGSLLDISAEPVCLLSARPPRANPGPYMFLGVANGQMVLLDLSVGVPAPGATLRIAVGDLLFLHRDVFADSFAATASLCRSLQPPASSDGNPGPSFRPSVEGVDRSVR